MEQNGLPDWMVAIIANARMERFAVSMILAALSSAWWWISSTVQLSSIARDTTNTSHSKVYDAARTGSTAHHRKVSLHQRRITWSNRGKREEVTCWDQLLNQQRWRPPREVADHVLRQRRQQFKRIECLDQPVGPVRITVRTRTIRIT